MRQIKNICIAAGLLFSGSAMAQDPGLTSVVVNPNPLAVNQTGSVQVQFTNSGAALPAGGAQITISFGPNFSYDAGQQVLTQVNGSNATTSDFTVMSWNPSPAFSVVLQNNAAIPAGISGVRKLTIPIKGLVVTSAGSPQNVSVQVEPLGAVIASNSNGNDQVTSNSAVVPAAALPLQLLDFTGRLKDANADLNWVTAQEENTSHFDIERSADAASWTRVGKIAAQGYKVAQTNYHATDDLRGITGTVYYRLKVVDRSDAFTYSRTVKLNIGNGSMNGSFSVFPTLVQQGADITIQPGSEGITEDMSVLICNNMGQVMRKLQFGQQNALRVSTAELSAGSYIVKIMNANSVVYTTKFIVQ